ncbi:hypothetical protein EDB86DRAFT_1600335 [Lactarius hatsudake]|nr:hypothetical protein EDB86DRAFT_1600335 [Lactarius hatsudake]
MRLFTITGLEYAHQCLPTSTCDGKVTTGVRAWSGRSGWGTVIISHLASPFHATRLVLGTIGMTARALEYKASRRRSYNKPFFSSSTRIMTDLTTLLSPSTLYLPLAKETGLPRRFNRRSTLPIVSTPLVTVQMVDTDPPPLSPVRVRDTNLLSPPPHTFRSRPRARRPPSASPEPSLENTRSIRSPDYSSFPQIAGVRP